jgi:zinc transporter 1/2/3
LSMPFTQHWLVLNFQSNICISDIASGPESPKMTVPPHHANVTKESTRFLFVLECSLLLLSQAQLVRDCTISYFYLVLHAHYRLIGVFGPILLSNFVQVKTNIIFIILKQFGTGIILSTAFAHVRSS